MLGRILRLAGDIGRDAIGIRILNVVHPASTKRILAATKAEIRVPF
jgi:hypothetical protein